MSRQETLEITEFFISKTERDEGLLRSNGNIDSTNYLTEHQNISGKEDTSNKTNSMSVTISEKSTKYPTVQAVEDYIDEIIGDINEDLMS